MLWKKIIDQAILHKQMNIPDAYARAWFNEGKNKLAMKYDTSCKKVGSTYTVTEDGETLDLPSECLRVSNVLDSSGEKYRDFSTTDTDITFRHIGTYTVTCLFETSDFTGSTLSPEIRSEFCLPLAKYIASMELKDIKGGKSQELEMGFWMDADMANTRLLRMNKQGAGKSRPIPRFR